jgi:hypothetical protein
MRTSRLVCLFAAAVGVIVLAALALAANSVVVESMTIQPGATGATIAVRLTNDVAIKSIVVPLVVRESSPGTFITSLGVSFADRLASPTVLDFPIREQYADEDGICSPGPHSGFSTVTFSDGGPHTVVSSPEGLLFARTKVTGTNLTPGADVTGSLVLTVNVSGTPGVFEIDTTCTNPANHLAFIDANTSSLLIPAFTKGVITVTSSDYNICFNPAVNYAVGTAPWSVFAADLDGDGNQDLVAANSVSNNVSLLMNNGNGTFAAAVNYATGSYPMSVYAADLDGDRDQDVVTANNYSNNVSVLKNNGNGTFASAVNYAVGAAPRSVFAADLDGDGDKDLVVANYTSGNISVLRNSGDGTFVLMANYAAGTAPISVSATDLDGDGDQDLVVANSGSNNVSVLMNNGNGTFAAAVNYPAGSLPFSVFAADLDGDGDPDLVTANDISSGTVSVLMNIGTWSGSFAPAVTYAAGVNPVFVCAADLNGDGYQDLAVANALGNNISVLKNYGNGTFAPAVNYAVGIQPWSIFAADLDGDGDQDLAAANLNSNIVSVLKNCSTYGPFRVTTLANSGQGSLRAAISAANASIFPNTITFGVAGVINAFTPLPALTNAGTAIRGFTAPGAVAPGSPTIILDGAGASSPGPGLLIQSSDNTVEGVIIRDFNGPGVAVTGLRSVSNKITDCPIFYTVGPGIDLGNDGITPNIYDPFMDSVGPNHWRNYPVFDSVIETGPGTFSIFGSAVHYAHVELYLVCERGDPSYPYVFASHGPAYLFLRSSEAGMYGDFSFSSIVLPEWSIVTATTTDLKGNTSEFALNRILVPSPLTVTAYSEPVPPVPGKLLEPMTSPAMQVHVFSPPNALSQVDSIGPTFNTFGSRATYTSTVDYNGGGQIDVRVMIASPDTGTYTIKYVLIGSPGTYLTGIGIDGHAEVKKSVTFVAGGQTVSMTFNLAPPLRGELTGDGVIDVFDVIAAINIVFSGAPAPDPAYLVDVNCDGVPDVFDVIYLINYTFSGGPTPCQ